MCKLLLHRACTDADSKASKSCSAVGTRRSGTHRCLSLLAPPAPASASKSQHLWQSSKCRQYVKNKLHLKLNGNTTLAYHSCRCRCEMSPHCGAMVPGIFSTTEQAVTKSTGQCQKTFRSITLREVRDIIILQHRCSLSGSFKQSYAQEADMVGVGSFSHVVPCLTKY